MRTVLAALLLPLVLGGCAQLRPLLSPTPSVDDTLAFIVRLGDADAEELAAVGQELEQARETRRVTLRRALWRSIPGHEESAPSAARAQLQAQLERPGLDRGMQDLLRVYLGQLERRIALLRGRRALAGENRELRQQIEALTNLERELETSGNSE